MECFCLDSDSCLPGHEFCWPAPRTSVQTAKLQDTARFAIFLFVVFAAVASLASVAILIGGAKGLGRKALIEHLLLAAATVVSSWFLIHTVFAMHYAHGYYHDEDEGPDFPAPEDWNFPMRKSRIFSISPISRS